MKKRNPNPLILVMQTPIDAPASTPQNATKPANSSGRSAPGSAQKKGGILAALRRSPLVGAELSFVRPRVKSRRVDL
jgi:hypothetical protein